MKLKSILATLTVAAATTILPAQQSFAQEAFVGEIKWVAFNFCPRFFAPAEGQILSISSNHALFSLLGTMYGGDGRTTFALPDLRGRSAVSRGNAQGLSDIRIGQSGGNESVVIGTANVPGHIHSVAVTPASQSNGNNDKVDGMLKEVKASSQSTEHTKITKIGSNHPVPVRDPFLGVQACIAMQGIYPSRP